MAEPTSDMHDRHLDSTPPDTAPQPDAGADTDLDRVEADLAGVEVALQRLADGTYWTDEVTGERIPDETLHADPTARRLPAT